MLGDMRGSCHGVLQGIDSLLISNAGFRRVSEELTSFRLDWPGLDGTLPATLTRNLAALTTTDLGLTANVTLKSCERSGRR